MISKGSALYLHAPKGCYDCDDCAMFIDYSHRCAIHSSNDYISPEGSCGYFVPGMVNSFGDDPKSLVTKQESGYVEDVNEASCKRCKAWSAEGWDCAVVDKDSAGDDPGIIHPDACCCLWQKDPIRGNMPDAAIEATEYIKREV